MIFRTNDVTLYPQSVLDISQVLPGLEAATGADMLVSPLDKPKLTMLNSSQPNKLAFTRHLRHGLLVQVKRGRDFTSSIPDLAEILERMQRVCERCWLLTVGQIGKNREGKATVDGDDTGFGYREVAGAIQRWQERGGFYMPIPRDAAMIDAIELLLAHIREWYEKPETRSKQVVRPRQQLLFARDARIELLMKFAQELGETRARALLKSQGTLANCITYLSDPHSPDYCKIPGIGNGIIEKSIQLLGLGENEILFRTSIQEEKTE